MNIQLVEMKSRRLPRGLKTFLASPAVDPAADDLARRVLTDIRARGDTEVAAYTKEFNRLNLKPAAFAVRAAELGQARREVPASFRRAVKDVIARVTRFAQAGLRRDWTLTAPCGGTLGERFLPLDRVGVYVPGGAAPLASTVLMTVPLARVAGVPEIVACTPAGPDGRVNPHILYALEQAGATEIYRLGGIQAIGAMAYGTQTIRRVDKIVGPGGPYVAAAKRLVYGEVAIDMVAGPSEVAVLADGTARADCVAADLLSQAEHGTGHERVLLVTTSAALARGVREELKRQMVALNRQDALARVLQERTCLVVVPDMGAGVDLINRFAPEHLEILARAPRRWLKMIRHAGAAFLGPWTPESAGDFVAGPSHVLPTGGTARYFSGLTVEDFRRRMSVLELTKADLMQMAPSIAEFARVEGLPAHGRSARARLGHRA